MPLAKTSTAAAAATATRLPLHEETSSSNTGRDDDVNHHHRCISMFNATAMTTAAAIVTYLLSTTSTRSNATKKLSNKMIAGTATINMTATTAVDLVALHHVYQADQPNKSAAMQKPTLNKQHPHYYGLKKRKTKDSVSSTDIKTSNNISNHPLTGTIVIGSVFLFITLSITAAIIVFCRKRNTVFVFNKSEQQEDDEADEDSDLELDNLSMNLEEWAAHLSLASSSSHASLTELEIQRNLFLPLHYDVVTYDEEKTNNTVSKEEYQLQVPAILLKKLKIKKLSKGLRKQLARRKQLEQLKRIQEELEATNVRHNSQDRAAIMERQEPSLFYRKDDRGGYSQMVVSAVAQTTESSSPRKTTEEYALAPSPSNQVGVRLAQHTLGANGHRISATKSLNEFQAQDNAPTPPPRQPRITTTRPWLVNSTTCSPFQAPTELRVLITQQPGATRTVLQLHQIDSSSTAANAARQSIQAGEDKEALGAQQLIADIKEDFVSHRHQNVKRASQSDEEEEAPHCVTPAAAADSQHCSARVVQ